MSHAQVTALVRAVSPRLQDCELTELERSPVDAGRAAAQHASYVHALQELGARIEWLPSLDEHPDGVFVEDTAVIVPELAVLTRPGAVSRQGEIESTGRTLARHRRLVRITAPGTLDGGDVLRIGRTVYVGLSQRTNPEGVAQLASALAPLGYAVQTVRPRGCLHLKSAVSFLPPDRVLVNPRWIEPNLFDGLDVIEVHPAEPDAANTLTLGATTLVSQRHPRTAERLRAAGVRARALAVDELHKAEAGLTCMSLILEDTAA